MSFAVCDGGATWRLQKQTAAAQSNMHARQMKNSSIKLNFSLLQPLECPSDRGSGPASDLYSCPPRWVSGLAEAACSPARLAPRLGSPIRPPVPARGSFLMEGVTDPRLSELRDPFFSGFKFVIDFLGFNLSRPRRVFFHIDCQYNK